MKALFYVVIITVIFSCSHQVYSKNTVSTEQKTTLENLKVYYPKVYEQLANQAVYELLGIEAVDPRIAFVQKFKENFPEVYEKFESQSVYEALGVDFDYSKTADSVHYTLLGRIDRTK